MNHLRWLGHVEIVKLGGIKSLLKERMGQAEHQNKVVEDSIAAANLQRWLLLAPTGEVLCR